jgi:very-short-patch-repair endonuclease
MPRKNKPRLFVVNPTAGPSKADLLIKEAAEAEAVRFVEHWETIKESCESPIEELLMAALFAESKVTEHTIHFMLKNDFPSDPFFDETAFVYQQIPIGQYRVDILIQDATLPFEIGKPRFMVVECDGHDFHEKTKAQARRDKQRDRFLQSKGFKVLRFTGSEIWEDPEKCAAEIIEEFACNDSWRNREK